MIKIRDYILLPRVERRAHIDLSQLCVEMCDGGTNVHHVSRGVLAFFLGTTVPYGRDIYLCHACNNKKCSEPRHLYWGTPKDNTLDQVEHGTYHSIATRMTAKLGIGAWKNHTSKAGRAGGMANKGLDKRRDLSGRFTVL